MINEITRWHDLEQNYHRSKCTLEALQEGVKQSAWAYRQAQQAEVEYLSGLRHLIDKITGNTDRLEQLQRKIRETKALHEHQKRELEAQELAFEELEREMQEMPRWEEVYEQASSDPESHRYLAQREKELCTELLKPLLAQTLEGLEAYRQQLRGGNLDRVTSAEEAARIGTAHIIPAKESHALLLRLKEAMEILEQPLEIGSYFENPAGFIVSAAARHNRLDRVSAAIAQAEAMQKNIQ